MIKKSEYDDRAVWFLNGVVHREDGPAVEYHNGTKYWFFNGESHREDGPAIEYSDGSKRWYLNGLRHRVDGPAIEHFNGTKEWRQNDRRHREDGPAVEYHDGYKSWYINNYLIVDIKLYLNKRFDNCIGQFLYKKDKEYLILSFQREHYYFYTVLWEEGDIKGKRYDCSLEELKSLL